MTTPVMVVDDEPMARKSVARAIQRRGVEVMTAQDGEEALARFLGAPSRVIFADVRMPRMDGLGLLRAVKQRSPGTAVVLMTGFASGDVMAQALRDGALCVLTKPVSLEDIDRVLADVLEAPGPAPLADPILAESPQMEAVLGVARRVAMTDATVLVHGETGTGKELVARALHKQSSRARGPFVAINCAALPAPLVESELFGYAKGAFTDARASKSGLFVEATGGSLFLDEVAELSLDNQAKLLRALQERRVRPVGSNTEVPFDARILAATHRELEGEIEAGHFRQDLFFRLNVIRIDLPPLRERGMDIVHLATHFLREVCARDGREVPAIPPEVAQKLLAYPWPGNVRELENAVERLAALATTQTLAVADLPENIRLHERERFTVQVDAAEEVVTLDQLEKRYVLRVLQLVKDNRSRAAAMLGIDRRTLYRRLEGWGLSTGRQSPPQPPLSRGAHP